MTGTARETTIPAEPRRRITRASTLIAAFSTIVEWYDFTLYIYFATVISRVFFGPGRESLLATLAAFAIAYLMRPLGALIFGHIGDRYGRRPMLLLSVAIMTLAMLGIGLLPTRDQIGPVAGLLILLLRCVMGFAVGGEYTGVVAYLLEGSPPERRGLITSLAAASSEVGALLAVGVSALTVSVMSQVDLENWGWRIPFLFGALLAGTVLIARSTMEESPDFEDQRATNRIPRHPLRHTFTHHRIGIFRGFAISALGSITYFVGITYVPTFLTSAGAFTESGALWLSTIAAVMVIMVTPLAAGLSDRVGRKPVLIGLCIGSAVLPITMFSFMAEGSPAEALFGALILAAFAGGVSAVGAVTTAEQFHGPGRLTGLALGATSATAIFGGLTPFVAQLWMDRTGWTFVPGLMIALVAMVVLPILFLMPETFAGRNERSRLPPRN